MLANQYVQCIQVRAGTLYTNIRASRGRPKTSTMCSLGPWPRMGMAVGGANHLAFADDVVLTHTWFWMSTIWRHLSQSLEIVGLMLTGRKCASHFTMGIGKQKLWYYNLRVCWGMLQEIGGKGGLGWIWISFERSRIQSIAHTHTEVFFCIPPFVHLFTFEKVGLKWLRALSWHIRDHVRHWVKLLKDMVVPCFHSWYVDVSLGITCQPLQGAGEECFGLC